MQVRFRPLTPGEFPNPTPEHDRQFSPFKVGLTDTLTLLEREIERLDGRDVVILLDCDESQIRLDGWPRVDAKIRGDAVVVMFDSMHGPLRYSTDRFRGASFRSTKGWQANLRAIALGLEALRRVDRYGIGAGGEQYQGWKQLGAGSGPTTKEQALRIIERFVDWGATADGRTMGAMIREALRNTHPDRGGDPDDFAKVQAARQILTGDG